MKNETTPIENLVFCLGIVLVIVLLFINLSQ